MVSTKQLTEQSREIFYKFEFTLRTKVFRQQVKCFFQVDPMDGFSPPTI
ncbi:hypothetical protein J6I92_08235 [Pseudidiomarina sp. 1APR75-15]|uniref:Uncharacterized protein n=1 Tax=Pseudidiomarina terrestris TaxID=2820060 RepID=A0ABT8MIV7_9GAMM|nr:hypothetical protein [Pseudidiomarina sp. 1APR75-15]